MAERVPPAKPKLDETHRTWLVTRWAAFARPLELLRDFTEEFGFTITASLARKYDLSGLDEAAAKKRGMAKWLPLFTETRETFRASVQDIPIANAAYRVRKLDEMFDIAFEKKNWKTAAQLLEQAAKETGGMFTNKREIDGTMKHTVEEVPDEIKAVSLAERLRAQVIAAVNAAAVAEPEPPAPATKH